MFTMADFVDNTLPSSESNNFRGILKQYRDSLTINMDNKSGDQILGQILEAEGRIFDEYGDMLSEEECEILTALSLVVGTGEKLRDVRGKDKANNDERTKVYEESIQTQRDTTRLILSNLNPDGKPNKKIVAYGDFLLNFLKDHFTFDDGSEIGTECSLMQGIYGMITTSMLFQAEGYQVRFPDIKWDLRHDVDLLVESPDNRIFGVDVKSVIKDQRLGIVGGSFFMGSVNKRSLPPEISESIDGFIVINTPPIKPRGDISDFYEMPAVGYPSVKGREKFSEKLKELVKSG